MNTSLSFLDPREMEHWNSIRGWLLPAAAESLHKIAKLAPAEGTVVEIGSFAGKSTVCIGKGLGVPARRMTSIDLRFQPDFRSNIGFYGYETAIQISSLLHIQTLSGKTTHSCLCLISLKPSSPASGQVRSSRPFKHHQHLTIPAVA
jgi:predicted O-methyltransferase YrrM